MKQDRFLCGESLLASADGRFILMLELDLGPVWQGFGSSKIGSGSGSSGGAAFLMEPKPFWKTFGKTASPVGLRF
jgi:hypothetical protein